MFTRHRFRRTNKLDCSHAMGTNALSPRRAESFCHFLLLSSSPLVYHGRQPTNLRVSFGTGAAGLQTSGLWVRGDAGACSSSAQRTATGNIPAQAKTGLEWATPPTQRTATGYAG